MLRWTNTVTANAASSTSVAASQTPGAAGNLTLTSSTVTFGSGAAQQVTLISGSNISNRTFIISGTNVNGTAITETITGPNNATVTSTNYFLSVTNIAISGSAAGALTAGNAAATISLRIYPPDRESNPLSIGFGCVSTSGTYTVQHTFDDVNAASYVYGASTNTWFNHPIVAAVTGNNDGNYAYPVNAIRVTMSAAGSVIIYLNQSGGGFQ